MKKYVFVANWKKPSAEERKSRSKVYLPNFHKQSVEAALSLGYEVYVGISRDNPEQLTCDLNIKFYDEHIYRNLLAFKDNYIAYKNLMNLLKTGNFEVIHCNTPIGGVIGRLCGKIAKVPKVIYTAHGFHFYKGASLINQTLFKWAEMIMAHYTDAIITINKEDYLAVQKFKLRNNGKAYYVPGVGVDVSTINDANSMRDEILTIIEADSDAVLIISVGDLNKNKNNKVIIKALSKLKKNNIHYLICGEGKRKNDLVKLTKYYNLEKNIHFMGYRTDIPQLLKSCDIFVMMSYREGLPRSTMEAMAAGLPCIVSNVRGNVDLIEDKKGGFLVKPDDVEHLITAIIELSENKIIRKEMQNYNLQSVKKYDVKNIKYMIKNVYLGVLNND